jgi:hypothetical protein
MDVYQLFQKCNLDVDTLKAKQLSLESVPSDKKELKTFLTNYEADSKSIDLMFLNEDWRRDYWFCENSEKLHYKFYLKEESRFIIQWTPGAIMLDLQMDSTNSTRTYEIANVPGKKGVYTYSSLGFTAIDRIKSISEYFAQFGFSFSENDISAIVDQLKKGYGYTGDLIKNKGSRSATFNTSSKNSSVQPDDYDDLIDLNDDAVGFLHMVRCRAIPILASIISIAGDIDIRENTEEISSYAKDAIKNLKEDGLQTKYCEAFIRKTIERAYQGFEDNACDIELMKSNVIALFEENYNSENFNSTFLIYILLTLGLTKTITQKMFDELVTIASEFDLTEEEVKQKTIECGYEKFFTSPNEESSHDPTWRTDEFYLGILGLEVGATLEDIKEARSTLVKFFHPDNYPDNEKKKAAAEEHLKKINNACDILVHRYKENNGNY